jgi:hypothetical protein
VRHRAGYVEPEESLAPLILRLFLFFNACAFVLLAFRSDVPDPGGAILLPVRGVSEYELTDSFFDRRDFFRQHGAIDIAAPWGTPVVLGRRRHPSSARERPRGLGIYQLDPGSAAATTTVISRGMPSD